jgi:ribosomal-protein-alanine N-acetyltransferase
MALIRVGGVEDLAEILAIQKASPQAAQWDVADYLSYDLRVSVEAGAVAGFAVWRKTAQDECELLNLAVAPERRRGGVGRSLVESLVESLETKQGVSVFLEVRESNHAARAFYESLGFQEVTIRYNYYDFPPESGIVMKFHSC